ncbi:MAG: hypothetical protein KatS3mg082_2759 [Nitrospiraceae bacterium]|nr:MAG: hypothetical protein KatS3mg082_2759 [Nitrospiraceae bacterium]
MLTHQLLEQLRALPVPREADPADDPEALTGEPLPVYGDGSNVRDWLYVEDHCAAIRAVLARGRVGETYNVGGDAERRNLEVVHALCDAIDQRRPRSDGQSRRVQIRFVKDRPGHDKALCHRRLQAQARTRLGTHGELRGGAFPYRRLVPRQRGLGEQHPRRQLPPRAHRHGGLRRSP